ncbi:MAG: S53 family peptidase [Candidatus Acidiferrales bacterium]
MATREARIELKKSARRPMAGSRRTGAANGKEQIEVTIQLRRGSAPAAFPDIQNDCRKIPSERSYLSREEFAAAHGSRPEDFAKVRTFAARFGLQVAQEDPARRMVLLRGSVSQFTKAFGAKMSRYSSPRGSYRGRTGTLTVPTEFKGIIEGVFGLDNRPQARPHFRVRKLPNVQGKGKIRTAAADVSYTPLQVAQAYNFPAGTDGSGEAIAILELGGGYKTADLTAYFKGLGIATPTVSAISVDGAQNAPTGSADGPDGEVALDIEIAGAIAPAAPIGVYFAPNTDQGFIDALTTAIHDTNLRPSIVSISWGGPESSWTEQARDSLNTACEDAATMGVTVLVASGDGGATDGEAQGTLTVDFPASSPYVLGCGGTRLTLSGHSIATEQAWNELAQGEGATGGGVSDVFPVPAFQKTADVPTSPSGFRGRGVPDVAGDADPTTGYDVRVDGETSVIGGTSAVAPLWASLLARINQSLGKAAGYLNPLIYAATFQSALHDITSGDNGGYSAGPGWDPCTGLGTPNGTALLAALKVQPASTPASSSGDRGRTAGS